MKKIGTLTIVLYEGAGPDQYVTEDQFSVAEEVDLSGQQVGAVCFTILAAAFRVLVAVSGVKVKSEDLL